jgi:hypothetical protein
VIVVFRPVESKSISHQADPYREVDRIALRDVNVEIKN